MEIRKYQKKDRGLLIDLWKNVFPNDPSQNEPSKVIDQKIAIDDMIFVAEHDNKIVGACIAGYDGHRGWLYAVAVSPKYRRSGTGTQLIKTAINTLKNCGCVKVNLQIRSTNIAVAKFYKTLGFSTEDRLSMGAII